MQWEHVLTILVANLGVTTALFLWLRTEARTDHRLALGMIDAIQKEIKDFHGRLCKIEERSK